MYQKLLGNARMAGLLAIDVELSEAARKRGCDSCGGVLHRAAYARKPRGPWAIPEEWSLRLSYCCAVDGCRRRSTPASVRFLGRKVYLGPLVVLVAALRQGPTPTRMTTIREVWGVGVRTVNRWRQWWAGAFGRSPFWAAARALFVRPVDVLPFSLVEAFGISERANGLLDLLRWLAPVGTPKGFSGHGF